MMKKLLRDENINTLWASLLINELVKNDISYFCISPGYRSAPLIHALTGREDIQTFIGIDERAAAYHALGYAKVTGKAAVLICTSGTALANYYPAIIEASTDHIPLIVLSADRPTELVETDANQTIDQTKIYSQYQKHFVSLPTPSKESMEQIELYLGKIDTAIFMAHQHPNGPIHLNAPFREPLEPKKIKLEDQLIEKAQSIFMAADPQISWKKSRTFFDQEEISLLAKTIVSRVGETEDETEDETENLTEVKKRPIRLGVIVVGKLTHPHDQNQVEQLVSELNWPVFYDITSSMKHSHFHPENKVLWDWDHPLQQKLFNDLIFQLGEEAKQSERKLEIIVLHLGGKILSKYYELWIKQFENYLSHYFLINPVAKYTRNMKKHYHSYPSEVHLFLKQLIPELQKGPHRFASNSETEKNEKLRVQLENLENYQLKVKERLEALPFSYLKIAHTISRLIPSDHLLFLGNSMPIRAFESSTVMINKKLQVLTNRGVSGIEGLLATASGAIMGSKQRLTLVIGDLSLLHDLNSLMLLQQISIPMIIIVVNNYSGGIFTKLAIKDYPETLNPLITTPHQWNFYHAAKQFNLQYLQVKVSDKNKNSCTASEELEMTYKQALGQDQHILIEILLENDKDNDAFSQFKTLI